MYLLEPLLEGEMSSLSCRGTAGREGNHLGGGNKVEGVGGGAAGSGFPEEWLGYRWLENQAFLLTRSQQREGSLA